MHQSFETLESWCYSVRLVSIIGKRAFIYVEITKYTAHAHISPLRRKFTVQILYFGTDLCL